MPEIENLTDEQLDARRREVQVEQERRQKLADGKQRIGEAVADYLKAAGIETPTDDHADLGELVIELVTQA